MNIAPEEMPREIDRLLEENEQMEATIQSNIKSYNKLAEYSKELEDRINKAIEYIEKELDIEKICRQEKSLTICKKELLGILKGSDKE